MRLGSSVLVQKGFRERTVRLLSLEVDSGSSAVDRLLRPQY